PFAGPQQVLRYLSRYTHRVAISNRRLVAADANAIAFRWKDYRIDRPDRWKTMTLSPHEFIRRFLMHVLPKGFHRIRHYGLFANGNRAESIAKARELLAVAAPQTKREAASTPEPDQPRVLPRPCPCCGGRMIVIEVFARGQSPRHKPAHPHRWPSAGIATARAAGRKLRPSHLLDQSVCAANRRRLMPSHHKQPRA